MTFPCFASQGAVLQSSDRGGIRIQYSKNPFGKKRDFGSFNDQSPYSPQPLAAASYQSSEAQVRSGAFVPETCS